MASNKTIFAASVISIGLAVGGLYIGWASLKISDKSYKVERWKDCEDRPIWIEGDFLTNFFSLTDVHNRIFVIYRFVPNFLRLVSNLWLGERSFIFLLSPCGEI